MIRRSLLLATLATIGLTTVHGGRMLMSQEGYQDMDAPIRGGGGGQPDFSNFAPPRGAQFGPGPAGLESQSSNEFGDFSAGAGSGGQGPQGFAGFAGAPPQALDIGGVGGGSGFGGPSGQFASEDGPSFGGPSSQAFDSFPEGPSGQGFGGPSQGSFSDDGPSQGWAGQGESGQLAGHPAFGGQAFQDGEPSGDGQFVRDQDAKLQAQLLRDDDDGDRASGGFGGGPGPNFGGPEGGMSFDEGGKGFGPDGGFPSRQPRTNLGGAWVGGNMISPKGAPGGYVGPQGLDGESQGVTRLDSATIGARSRQLGIRPPAPTPMTRGPRGPIMSSFNKFRPMMMGFRPPPPRGAGVHRGPPPPPPMMGMPMPAMSQPDFQVFKPQFPLASRPQLHFIPMNEGLGGPGGANFNPSGQFGAGDQLMDMARPRGHMVPYPKNMGQDVSNINTFVGMSMYSEPSRYYKKK